MNTEEILGKMDHGVPPTGKELLALAGAEAEDSPDSTRSFDLIFAAVVVAALDRLTEAVQGIAVPEGEGDARSVAKQLVLEYDRWIAETSEPQRLRDAEGKLAGMVRDLRSLVEDLGGFPPGREG